MKGIFRKILLWFGGLLLFSSVAFLATTWFFMERPSFFGNVRRLQLADAVMALKLGGKPALEEYLTRINRQFDAQHYLVDGQARDALTGEDRRELWQRSKPANLPRRFPVMGGPPRGPENPMREMLPDGSYAMLLVLREAELRPSLWANLPSYLWIVLVIVLLCYALAVTLARPLRDLRETMVRFGAGDLDARSDLRSKDEIGDLAQAFNDMAGRTKTLLTAERRLLQDISHELRSPLNRLGFAVELARSSSDRNGALDRIKHESNRLTSLVGELIQMTRAEGDPAERSEPGNRGARSAPVVIHRRAFVGGHSILLKGASIGEAAVVGAGSVVRTAVPPQQVWAGNPARFLAPLPARRRAPLSVVLRNGSSR